MCSCMRIRSCDAAAGHVGCTDWHHMIGRVLLCVTTNGASLPDGIPNVAASAHGNAIRSLFTLSKAEACARQQSVPLQRLCRFCKPPLCTRVFVSCCRVILSPFRPPCRLSCHATCVQANDALFRELDLLPFLLTYLQARRLPGWGVLGEWVVQLVVGVRCWVLGGARF